MEQGKAGKSNKTLLIGVGIGLIILIAVSMILMKGGNTATNAKVSTLEGSPAEILDKAILNTLIQLNTESDIILEEDGTKTLEDILASDIVNSNLALTYKDINGVESLGLDDDMIMAAEMMSGVGLKYDVSYTNDLSDLKCELDLIKGEDSVMNLGVYKAEDVLGLTSSNLFENQYTIGLDNILDEILESGLYKELGGMPLSELERKEIDGLIKEMQDAIEQSNQPVISDECVSKSGKLLKEFVASCEVEEKGKDGDLTEYVLKVDGKSAGKFITDEMELLLQEDYVKLQMQANPAAMDIDLDEMREEIESVFEEVSVEVVFKLDEKYIRSMNINLTDKTYPEAVTIEVELGKDKYLSSEIKSVVKFIDGEEESEVLTVDYSNNFGNKEELLTSKVDIKFSDIDTYTNIGFGFESKYDKSKDEDNLEVDIFVSVEDEVQMSISSVGTQNVSKDEYSLQNNELTFDVENLQTGENFGIGFELDMKVNKGSKEDLEYKGEGKSIDILSSSVQDIDSLIREIQSNFMSSAISLLYF